MSDTYRQALKEHMLVPIRTVLTQRPIKKNNPIELTRADNGSSCSAPRGKFIFRAGVGKNGSLQKLVAVHPPWPQHYPRDAKILEETRRNHNTILFLKHAKHLYSASSLIASIECPEKLVLKLYHKEFSSFRP